MKILTSQHAIPSRKITNDDVIEAIRDANTGMDRATLDLVEDKVRQYMRIAGTEVRYLVDHAAGERAIDLVTDAGRNALKVADVDEKDVDFVIYTGVGRGWLEPAMANVVQAELGLSSANVFDVLDACASWSKAMHIAHSFIRSGVYRTGMIVNCEASFFNYANCELGSIEDLDHRFAAFTVGEAATATLVGADEPDDDFYFTFKSFGEHFDLCMIPLPNMQDFSPRDADPRKLPGKFFSLSGELISKALNLIFDTFKNDPFLVSREYDRVFIHAASEKASEMIVRRLRLPKDGYFPTHPRFGNTVSSSVPLGMSLAMQEGKLNRGDRTLIVMGSAGISVGFVSFTF